MRESKIPTILAIFILIVALTSALFVVNQMQSLTTSAENGISPQDVRITNVKDTSFTVSWLTDKPSIAYVAYVNSNGESANSSPTQLSMTHFVTIQNLHPNTNYSFKINSAGALIDNNGSPWQTQTQNTETPTENRIVSGQVLDAYQLPAKNALVYVTTNGVTYSTQTTQSGTYLLTLPALDDSASLQILIELSGDIISTAKTDLASANPVPPITAGKSYDFQGQSKGVTPDTPKVPIVLP